MTSSSIGIDTTTKQRVDIPKPSRLRGLYIIGAPGTGKSGLIENLIIQDIEQDIGVCLLDPHGDLTDAILSRIKKRLEDVILLDITDEDYPFGLNLFSINNPKSAKAVQEIVDQIMHIFDKLFDVSRSTPRIAQYLRNCTHTLIANPGYTMAEIPLLLMVEQCRKKLVANVSDPKVRLFWTMYNAMKPSEQQDHAESTLNKLDEFLSPLLINIVGQAKTTINLRSVMDERKILLVKLDARLTSVTNLIGSVILALFLNAAYSRADLPLEKRKQFNLYADEFQRFATEDFATLFTEARKFGIALTVAHQMREQLDRQNRSATVNVANLVVFKVSSPDADELAGEFDCTPPLAELRREEKLTPVSNPFDWLVSGHTHTSPVVNKYADGTLRKIHLTLTSTLGKFGKQIEEEKAFLSEFNSFLYRAMTSSDALSMLCEKTSLSFLLRLNDKYPFGTYYFGKTVASLPEVRIERYLFSYYYDYYHQHNRIILNYMSEYINMPDFFTKRDEDDTVDEHMTTALIAMIQALRENQYNQASAHFAKLAEEKLRNRHTAYLAAYEQGYEKISSTGRLLIDIARLPPRIFLSPEQEAEKWNKEFERWITEERLAFETFIKQFRDFVLALAKEPIASSSGIYEMTPGIQRTFADMQNEIASKIVKLDQYTARVKIASDNTTGEHIIQTLNPKKESRLSDAVLNKRIADIQAQNITDGYVRERTEVEDEIRRRQEQCSEPSLLREPIKPPEEPPSSPRRKKIT